MTTTTIAAPVLPAVTTGKVVVYETIEAAIVASLEHEVKLLDIDLSLAVQAEDALGQQYQKTRRRIARAEVLMKLFDAQDRSQKAVEALMDAERKLKAARAQMEQAGVPA